MIHIQHKDIFLKVKNVYFNSLFMTMYLFGFFIEAPLLCCLTVGKQLSSTLAQLICCGSLRKLSNALTMLVAFTRCQRFLFKRSSMTTMGNMRALVNVASSALSYASTSVTVQLKPKQSRQARTCEQYGQLSY